MQTDFPQSLARILVYEGGKVDDPRDPGGRTNKGVTQATYNAWLGQQKRPAADVYNITDADVQAIYKAEYWDRVGADSLPAGVDFCTFDGGVNSGPGRGVIWLQQALGDAYKDTPDGVMGPNTLQAVTDFGDMTALIQAICSHRLGTLEKLPTWGTFGKGWSARVANVQKTACAMVSSATLPNPVDVTSIGGHKKATIIIPQSKTARVVANTTAVATGVGTVASQAAVQFTPIAQQFPNWHWLQMLIGALTAAAGSIAVLNHVADSAKKLAAAGALQSTVDIDADANLPQVSVVSVQP